jgi:hypothetical protein
MIDNKTLTSIVELLNKGKTADEIAQDFTDALNAALAHQESEAKNLKLMERIGALTDDINVSLLDWCDVKGVEHEDQFFTTDEVCQLFADKMASKTAVKQPTDVPKTTAQPVVHKVVVTDDDVEKAWGQMVDFLADLFKAAEDK